MSVWPVPTSVALVAPVVFALATAQIDPFSISEFAIDLGMLHNVSMLHKVGGNSEKSS